MRIAILLSAIAITTLLNSCSIDQAVDPKQDELACIATLEKHLQAVTDRNIPVLLSTMSPTGEMQLILPSTEIITGVAGFMEFHESWFADTTTVWSFETKILNAKVGKELAFAVVEIIYREPERDGKPYFNRQIVSYALQKEGKQWFVLKDHCTSIEKSTDQQSG